MEIDLSRFKVVYDEKVFNALSAYSIKYYEDKLPMFYSKSIVMPQFITILVINEDGNIMSITDEAWRFKFADSQPGDGDVNPSTADAVPLPLTREALKEDGCDN